MKYSEKLETAAEIIGVPLLVDTFFGRQQIVMLQEPRN